MPRILPATRFLLLAVPLGFGVAIAYARELEEAPPFVPPELIEAEALGEERSVLVKERNDEEAAVALADRQPDRLQAEVLTAHDELLDAIRATHPWARHEPGAWRRIVIVAEVFDEDGVFVERSQSQRTERLTEVDASTYTLSIESVVELGGLRTPAPAESQTYSLLTDRPVSEAPIEVTAGEPSSISLGSSVAACQTWTIESRSDAGVETETIHLATDSTPALLRRERQATLDGEPSARLVESVSRLDSPTIYGESLSVSWHVASSATHPDGASTETFLVCGDDAPGGVFQRSVTEYDPSGRKTRWAVMRLVASGRTPGEKIESGVPDQPPAVSIEVRPRRFLRMLRREQRQTDDP